MSDAGLSTSQVSAAGAYARAETLAAAIPVRPIDPTRQRFQVQDQVAGDKESARSGSQSQSQFQAETSADNSNAAGTATSQQSGFGRGFGLLGALTAFLTRIFSSQTDSGGTDATDQKNAGTQAATQAEAATSSQAGASKTVAASVITSGISAYSRTASMVAPNNGAEGMDVLSPSLPRLASGRAIDLII